MAFCSLDLTSSLRLRLYPLPHAVFIGGRWHIYRQGALCLAGVRHTLAYLYILEGFPIDPYGPD